MTSRDGGVPFAMMIVFFSKDRPLQLDAALRSWGRHCRDAANARVVVLYKASSTRALSLYRRLIRDHPTIDFVREHDFRRDLLTVLRGWETVGFVVDDTIFVRPFSLASAVASLEQNPDALGFSLRLGHNTTHCYTMNRAQALPAFASPANGALKFKWVDADCDFGYPLELSSSLYRGTEILPLLEQLEFKNPNSLESAMAAKAPGFVLSHPALLCPQISAAFSVPANRVQQVLDNRAGNNPAYAPELLASVFAQGERVRIEAFDNFTPTGCHQEVELPFVSGADPVPWVSVIIPCYNQAAFLPDAMASVFWQTFKDWELIIVNDGSRDETSQVAQEWIRQNPGRRIRLLEKRNEGLAEARNDGIRAASGAYILPLDADDKIAPAMLEKTVALLEQEPSLGIVYTDRHDFGESEGDITVADYQFAKLHEINQLNYCALFRWETWEAAGGYNPNMIWGYEDWDFWLACGEQGHMAKRIPEPLFMYRRRKESMFGAALERDATLRARIALNHPALFDAKIAAKAAAVWSDRLLPLPPGAPKVSVIMPTGHQPNLLRAALRNLLAQTFCDFEIIVVNDGGVDVSSIVERAAGPTRAVSLRHAAPRGLAAARNTGVRAARGRYVAFLDETHRFHPEHLQTLVGVLETGGARVAYTDGNALQDWDADLALAQNPVPLGCFLLERIAAIAAGPFDEALPALDEWDFCIRLARLAAPIRVRQATVDIPAIPSESAATLQATQLIYRRYRARNRAVRAQRKMNLKRLEGACGERGFFSRLRRLFH